MFLLWFVAACTHREPVPFGVFQELVRRDEVAEVTVYKPVEPKKEMKVEGRYRRSRGDGSYFQTEGIVDEFIVGQMKASGVILTFRE